MKIQRVNQFEGTKAGSDLHLGFSLNFIEHQEARYYDYRSGLSRNSGGWTKDRWLSLCNNFRLEFVYDKT